MDIVSILSTKIKRILRWTSYKNNIFVDIEKYDDSVKYVLDSLKEGGFLMPTRKINFKWFPGINAFGGYTYHIPYIFQYINVGMHWKDKYGTPRFEGDSIFGPSPAYIFTILRLFRIVIYYEAPEDPNDKYSKFDHSTYWEMWMWYDFYQNKDIDLARKTWPWTNMNDESTWTDYFIQKT